MEKPIILINAKAYEQAMGGRLQGFVDSLLSAEGKEKAEIILAVQACDILRLAQSGFGVFAQHVDGIGFGSHTGHNHPLAIAQAGAHGTLLNHAERQISEEEIVKAIEACKAHSLIVCLCANTPEAGATFAKYKPDYIAIEPPDLIGGDVSVSKARPEIITESLEKIRAVNSEQKVLVGAGIKNGEDLKIALELGCGGVLLASGIAKAENPGAALSDLLSVL